MYGMHFANIVATFVGDEFAGVGVPGIFGLLLGASIAAIISKLHSVGFWHLWYFPVTCFAAGVSPIVIIFIAMSLGPV